MATGTKLAFIAVGLGLLAPALYNLLKATTFQERRYDRHRNRKPKPVGPRRYSRLWVVDDEDSRVNAPRHVEREEPHR